MRSMLTELRIADLGVIGEASIAPSAGFTVVTGETGAGKTMIVSGLSLLTGVKADPRLIRVGASRALVEGRWALTAAQAAVAGELGAELEDVDPDSPPCPTVAGGAEVLVSRQVTPSRSRMTIGGAQVPISQGADSVGEWVTIHGQSEQMRLGTPQRQREVLDAYAGPALAEVMVRYQRNFAERQRAAQRLDELLTQDAERTRELGMLRFGLEEIGRADPEPGEDLALAAEAKRLQAVDDLRLAAKRAAVALSGDADDYAVDGVDALALVAKAGKALAPAQGDDPRLAQIAAVLADAAAGLTEAASGLASYLDRLEADPVRLEWIASRRAELQTLTRKYGPGIDDVLAWADKAAQRVFELDSSTELIESLRELLSGLDETLARDASQLTEFREKAAAELAGRTQAELAALAMPQAELRFQLARLAELGPYGQDQVQLLFTANPGSAPGPLGKVASGGELSRVRLALEVVLASSGQTLPPDEDSTATNGKLKPRPRTADADSARDLPVTADPAAGSQTFVFDEVDA
ncbi:MAG: hypothetical protein LBK28_03720, partial [Propionibacteriaceae bacterium]|nr:hypothetical protein [Propionibacteriaceae bacterium]